MLPTLYHLFVLLFSYNFFGSGFYAQDKLLKSLQSIMNRFSKSFDITPFLSLLITQMILLNVYSTNNIMLFEQELSNNCSKFGYLRDRNNHRMYAMNPDNKLTMHFYSFIKYSMRRSIMGM